VRTLTFLAATAMLLACSKQEPAAPAPMKKVEAAATGLPAAAPPRAAPAAAAPGSAGQANPHAGMAVGGGGMANPHAGVGAGMAGGRPPSVPDDAVHGGMGGMGGGMPSMPGHAMVRGPVESDGAEVPLRKQGLGSAEELGRALARIPDEADRKAFEDGFRATFSTDKSKRDIGRAKAAIEPLVAKHPGLAEGYRALAYVALSDRFDMAAAEGLYLKAVEVRPDYGEAHYALASLYAATDRAKGAEHLKKALDLKVPDDQGLKGVYGL